MAILPFVRRISQRSILGRERFKMATTGRALATAARGLIQNGRLFDFESFITLL